MQAPQDDHVYTDLAELSFTLGRKEAYAPIRSTHPFIAHSAAAAAAADTSHASVVSVSAWKSQCADLAHPVPHLHRDSAHSVPHLLQDLLLHVRRRDGGEVGAQQGSTATATKDI